MSLLDMAIAMAVISVLLFGLCGVSDSLVSDSADRQTAVTLQALGRALELHRDAHGDWPSASEPTAIDSPLARCLAALRSSPVTARLVEDLPGQIVTDRGHLTLTDGFGHVMLYVHPSDPSPAMTALAARFPRPADGRPFIVSAGRDGQFGDLAGDNPARTAPAADNLDSL